MKTPREQDAALKMLSQNDTEELKVLIKNMENLLNKEVTIAGLQTTENVLRTLNSFREKYQLRVIQLLKSGFILS